MGLTMRERKAVIKQTAARYRRSSKKQKAKILNEFVEITGYNRTGRGRFSSTRSPSVPSEIGTSRSRGLRRWIW
ncbi:hypothetical protein ES708_12669 [subsurface metagenome]